MTQPRFDKLNASLQTSDLDAVILNPGPTLTYLTGLHFHLMERPVVFLFAKDQHPAIVLPELELQKVASLPYKLHVFSYPENPAEWDSTDNRQSDSFTNLFVSARRRPPASGIIPTGLPQSARSG